MGASVKKWAFRLAATMLVVGLSIEGAHGETDAVTSARFVYAAMAHRHWLLAECSKVDPARKGAYDDARRSYDRGTKVLAERVRLVITADQRRSQPGISDAAALAGLDQWIESVQNKTNHAMQSAQPGQFREQCDFIANPAGRARYGVTRKRELGLIGLPTDEYPEHIKAIQQWRE